MLTDVRHALRALLRSRGYLLAVTCTLALGVGVTTALFGVVDRVLLRPLPYQQPERLVRVWADNSVGKAVFAGLRERSRSYASLGAYTGPSAVSVRVGEAAVRTTAAELTAGLLPTLGVTPAAGRAFRDEDGAPGAEPAALVSDAFWRERMGGTGAAVGRTVTIDGVSHRVVGVMPRTFALPSPDVAVWTATRLDPGNFADWWWMWRHHVVGRLAPAVTPAQARDELQRLLVGARSGFPMRLPDTWGQGADVVPLQESLVAGSRGTLVLLLGAVGVVLLVAVVNASGLAVVRAIGRVHEVTVRAALGAARARLLRALVAEGVVVGTIAGALGTALAWGLTALILRWMPRGAGALPRVEEVGLDLRALGVALAVALLASVLVAVLPALGVARPDLRGALGATRTASASRTRRRTMEALVVAQLALGVVLAVGAGMLGVGLTRLRAMDPGFRADHVTVAEVPMPAVSADSTARGRAFFGAVLAGVRAIPGVQSAAVADGVPFDNDVRSMGVVDVEAHPTPPGAERPNIVFGTLSPGFFATMGIPLQAGRDFSAADDAKAPLVAVVDAEAARVLWPGRQDVLGQRVKFVYLKDWITVVGVVGSVRRDSLTARPLPTVYLPIGQGFPTTMRVVTRGTADAAQLAPAFARVVREVDASVPLGQVRPLAAHVADSAARPRFVALLLLGFALLAVGLGAVGVYGVAAFAVARRTRELGVRMALGATPGHVRRLVLGDGGRLAVVGVALGIVGALAAARLAGTLVPGLLQAEPLVLAGVAAALAGVSLLATALPARRAARVEPVAALRAD